MGTFGKWIAGAVALCASALAAQQAPRLAPSVTPSLSPSSPASVTAGGLAPTSPPEQGRMTKADVDAWLDGFMPYALRNGDVAGAVVTVVRDGQILTARGFGHADIASSRPVDPERTLFRPGSVSKLVTWTAVMQQVEAGRIDLDADINTYLDFKIPPRDGKPVTMRQMMTHTAGFEEHNKNIIFINRENIRSLGDYLKDWIPTQIFAPGSTPAYSNYATALAGYVVQRVAGMPFNDYTEQRIFRPLGMANATMRQPLPARFASQMSSGYKRASEKPTPFEIVGPAPAGSLSASGTDMARFMIAHLENGRGLMSPATARQMHGTPTTMLPPLNRMMLGFFETNVNGHKVIAHLGDTQVFHTALHLFMNERTGIYLSVNSAGRAGASSAIRSALLLDFANRYFPREAAQNSARVDAKTSAEHARMMAGQWRSSRRVDTGFMRALGLAGQTPVSIGPKGELVVPSLKDAGGATRKWEEITPFLWREVGGQERLAAKVVDGKVVRWSIDTFAPFTVFDRVPTHLSAVWVLPAFYAALAVLLLAFLHWPAAALVRRHYRSPLAAEGAARHVYRAVRLGAGLVLVMLVGWIVVVTGMMDDLTALTPKSDGKLWFLQGMGLLVFVATAALAAWNLLLAFKAKRRWMGKLGAVLILLAALMVLYLAVIFGLVDMTVNY